MITEKVTINFETKAIAKLRPNCGFVYVDGKIQWADPNTPDLTEAELQVEVSRLQAEYDAQSYARSRSSEYPPITDYLDGVVKNDQAQIDAYIAACQAVKAKYPKE